MARSEESETGCAERLEAARTRYLELLKAALLDEHYLDNEARIEYLVSLPPGMAPDVSALRDPPRHLPVRFDRLAQARRAGQSADIRRNLSYFPYTDMGRAQLDRLHTALLDLHEKGVDGDFAEFGVARGGGGILMRAFLAAYEITGPRVWLCDRFLASDPQAGSDADTSSRLARFRADLNQVRDGYSRFGVLDERVRFLQAVPQDALAAAPVERLALARLGAGLGRDLQPLLEGVHARLAPGGIVIVEGTGNPGVERTVREFRDRVGRVSPLERVDWNAVTWVADAPIERASVVAAPRPRRVAIVPAAPTDAVDLSIVVVFYNMRREADRTLLSLSRSYQRDIEDLDYEVIAVENGSSPEQRLGSEYVESFGPEFRYLDLGADATPSPTRALNAGAAIARGRALAFMIDGAHVLTPGVLSLGVTAMQTYAPAVVAVQQWYLGPGQQGDVMHGGYDQTAEDRLFERIRWPTDGYRLFEIGHFIGDRDWFDGIVESNCVFVPRELLEQYGAYDDSFSMPGGGYANLDLFERIGAAPGVNVASILGQGTFHQVHGGTTTNVADAISRRELVSSYGVHYGELRGRRLAGLTKPVNYVGAMATKAARRTRSRRDITLSFDALRDPVSSGDAISAMPVADELKLAAIEAVWEHRTWREATWLGHRVARFPTDLHSYQELISSTRPTSVVVIGDDDGLGGRALFIASICDALDGGRVVAIGNTNEDRPVHPRIVHIVGAAETAEVVEQVRQVVGDEPRALLIIGLGDVLRVVGVFELYAPLVPVDSYVVIENTVVNGRPVESGFGPGPHEAVVDILGRHREFVSDPACERYTLTFNKGGFLRRVGWTA